MQQAGTGMLLIPPPPGGIAASPRSAWAHVEYVPGPTTAQIGHATQFVEDAMEYKHLKSVSSMGTCAAQGPLAALLAIG